MPTLTSTRNILRTIKPQSLFLQTLAIILATKLPINLKVLLEVLEALAQEERIGGVDRGCGTKLPQSVCLVHGARSCTTQSSPAQPDRQETNAEQHPEQIGIEMVPGVLMRLQGDVTARDSIA